MDALLDDERFATGASRSTNRAELGKLISMKFEAMQVAQVLAALRPAGVPAEAVKDLRQLFEDPQAQALRLSQPLARDSASIPVIAPPYHLSALPEEWAKAPPPGLGEHTDRWLREIGLPDAEIARLRADGAI
jgi:crotonobetainyl-CoA:carnitine CoA-transferase CaiB-like acyl-CoA transferase